MPAFNKYLARCQSLLQTGKPVTDVLWYLGDGLDHKPRQDASLPAGFQYDYVNTDGLLNCLHVEEGMLKTDEGIEWKYLWLPPDTRVTERTLRRLHELVLQGATIIGRPSSENPTLVDGAAANERHASLIHGLWGDENLSLIHI